MIAAFRWRHDGEMSSVLLVGNDPVAEVARNRGGKPGCTLRLNRGRGIERLAFAKADEAMRHAERVYDDQLREQLTPEARATLRAAELL
jgi:hypothetical protein